MRFRIITLAVAALAYAPALATAQQFTTSQPIGTLAVPVRLDSTDLFQAVFVSVGQDVFIAGQPTERALREMKARGVTTVVNLRTPPEMARIGFDEEALVKSLGMRYVYLPVRGNEEFPYSPATLKSFTEALESTNGKVLLHCTIAWRASHLWAAYLIQERNVPVEEALTHTRAINLMDDHRMGSGGRQPVEDFLGRELPTLGRGRR
ncbi:MAG TPA: sulfur transferase domain-containing protein [Gemmatimonadaceae bacterium]